MTHDIDIGDALIARHADIGNRQRAEAACQDAAERIAFAANDDERQAALAEVREADWKDCRMTADLQLLADLLDSWILQPVPAGTRSSPFLQRAVDHFLSVGVLIRAADGALELDADVARDWRRDRNLLTLLMRAEVAVPPAEEVRPAAIFDVVQPASILRHGERSYSAPGFDAIAVSEKEDAVLAVFLKNPVVDSEMLITLSGEPRAPETLRGLATKYQGRFAPFIALPGGKGKGGYKVVIQHTAS